MRFVTAPKHTSSFYTIKGWSNRSHHPRKAHQPVDFVGVDGEGVTDAFGRHRYVLFGVGQDQISNPDGLHWTTVFEFLYSHYRPRTAFVGFYLGYDFTQIIKTMPEDKAWMLLTSEGRNLRRHKLPGKPPHPCHADGWYFDILGFKRLRIRPKACACDLGTCECPQKPWMYICDVGAFFQTSFLKVIDPKGWPDDSAVVTPEEYQEILRGKTIRSTAVLDDDMYRYNALENVVLARVLKVLQKGFNDIGVYLPPSKWFGPGQAAQAWLKSQVSVPSGAEVTEHVPVWFLEAARMSYFGGWFEIMMHGIIPGVSYEYDINSAYPSIIAKLPCLLHGVYSMGVGMPSVSDTEVCLVYAQVWSPGMPNPTPTQHIGAMLHRDATGRISRPMATEGWYWWHELKAAEKAKTIKRLGNKRGSRVLRWVKYSPCKCPAPMSGIAGLYDKRLAVGKTSPLGKAAKLVYNSAYGKFAQSVGSPVFGNPVYASLITAGCRTQILEAIASHPKGMDNVAMVATDAVYFLNPHPGLPCSESLGEWDYQERTNLTLFKPGVYWDDKSRGQIARGESPSFKARGFKAADFASQISRVDSEFGRWRDCPTKTIPIGSNWVWPRVEFNTEFAMTTALQALRRKKWHTAGKVQNGVPVTQDSDPSDKRTGLFRDTYNDRTVYRSLPHYGMVQVETEKGYELQAVPSQPYERRFGMEDPWSDEYQAQLGETPDGPIGDILAWILKGE